MKKVKRMSEGDWVALRLFYLMTSTDPSWVNNEEVNKVAMRYFDKKKELDKIHREYQSLGFLKHSSDIWSIRKSTSLHHD